MCGLAGFLDRSSDRPSQQLRELAVRMADTLRHRGPNDAGTWDDPPAGYAVGFRRLSIIDLSPHGHQPMPSDDGRFVLAFNGEIYNHADVRAELGDGRPYRGHSDTEVMLRAFERWGPDGATRRFVGMFAFALWDRRDRILTLGRDRLGEKPLYYGRFGDTFLFGSELKALRAHPAFRGEIDRDALAEFMRLGYVPAPMSIYRGVFKLPPGTLLTLTADGTPAKPVPYWSARDVILEGLANPFTHSPTEAVERLDAELRRTVREQMVADVPLGAFLSGGTDSSTVIGVMQSLSPRPVKTFTIGFQESEYDEAAHARAVAKHLGTEHTELYVTAAEARAVVPDLPRMWDEPFADSSQIPTYLVSRLAARDVTVSLSGDGGDELFAGYRWYQRSNRLWNRLRWAPPVTRHAVAAALTRVPARGWDRVLRQLTPVMPGRMRRDWTGDKVHKFAALIGGVRSVEQVYDGLTSTGGPAEAVSYLACASRSLAGRPRYLTRSTDSCSAINSATCRTTSWPRWTGRVWRPAWSRGPRCWTTASSSSRPAFPSRRRSATAGANGCSARCCTGTSPSLWSIGQSKGSTSRSTTGSAARSTGGQQTC